MSSEWIALLSALLVALVSGAVTILVNRLSRKDSKDDKQDEVVERLDKIDKKLDALSSRVDETAVVQARVRILRFADEIIHKQRHSREHFEQLLEDVRIYGEYCTKNPGFRNEITTASVDLIRTTYADRLAKNDFE